MATVDTADASASPISAPSRGKKRPRSLFLAMSAPDAVLIIHGHRVTAGSCSAAVQGEDRQPAKRHGRQQRQQTQPLLPGLPDHLAQLCLSRVPPRLLHSVCRPWRRLLYSPSTPPFPALYALLSSPSPDGPCSFELQSFDPISSSWSPLPSPLPHPPFLLRHPAYLSRQFPVQSVATGDSLVLLAATACDASLGGQEGLFVPALHRPLVFHVPTGTWRHGPPFRPSPRRWCVAGAMQGKVYVGSGIAGPDYDATVARAMHRWDVSSSWPRSLAGPDQKSDAAAAGTEHSSSSRWEDLAQLKDSRFSRDAVDAVAARGKLYMINARGGWAREGAAYDPSTDRWGDMPPGMLMGWTGPAAVLSPSEEEQHNKRSREARDGGGSCDTIYCVEAADGVLWAYDWEKDKWAAVLASERLKGAVQLTAGGGGGGVGTMERKLCAVLAGGAGVAVIDVGARRMWEVQPPEGRLVVGVHELPRMSRPELADEEEEEEGPEEDQGRRRITTAHQANRVPRV